MNLLRLNLILFVGLFLTPIAGVKSSAASESAWHVALERAKAVAQSEDWMKPNWSDEELDTAISELVQCLRKLKAHPKYASVSFQSLTPSVGDDRQTRVTLRKQLFVTSGGEVSHAHDSIILADGSVKISHAKGCLIIASDTVVLGHGRRNLIIAGREIRNSHDGHPDPDDPDASQGSVLVSGGVAHVSHAHDTTICAPKQVTISNAVDVLYINSPKRKISHATNGTVLVDQSGTLPASSNKQAEDSHEAE